MHRTLNILDAEQNRYRELHAALAGPLPHLEIADRRAQHDRFDRIPHIDADARARQIRNAAVARVDERISVAAIVVGTFALATALAASLDVVASYVGSVL